MTKCNVQTVQMLQREVHLHAGQNGHRPFPPIIYLAMVVHHQSRNFKAAIGSQCALGT